MIKNEPSFHFLNLSSLRNLITILFCYADIFFGSCNLPLLILCFFPRTFSPNLLIFILVAIFRMENMSSYLTSRVYTFPTHICSCCCRCLVGVFMFFIVVASCIFSLAIFFFLAFAAVPFVLFHVLSISRCNSLYLQICVVLLFVI